MTVGELITILEKYPRNVNIDIADRGIYSNIHGLAYTKWTDREGIEYETYSIIPEKYRKEDAIRHEPSEESKETILPLNS